ncbi:MAG: hypothetical protein KC900_02015 [Candidatus Omnitrophica bacterium]|nr:hypothetical protein [Candidatus Omnitrophota bacterium]
MFTDHAIASLIFGGTLVFFGRNLFWFFVGVAGFLAGYEIASQTMISADFITLMIVAAVAGVLGMILAVVLQKAAVVVAGFLTGALIAMDVCMRILVLASGWEIPTLIGGMLGGVIGLMFLDWALIFLSSLLGAAIVVRPYLYWGIETQAIAFVALTVLGMAIQAQSLEKKG